MIAALGRVRQGLGYNGAMKRMPTLFHVIAVAACLTVSLFAHAQDGDGQAGDHDARLLALLDEFLAGASVNDRAVHERFWADDLVYTSSSGARFGKQAILDGIDAGAEAPPGPPVRYWAEEAQVMQFGDTAVVAFRLMREAQGESGAEPERNAYFNTGTFVLRDGAWRAVAWQATAIPSEP